MQGENAVNAFALESAMAVGTDCGHALLPNVANRRTNETNPPSVALVSLVWSVTRESVTPIVVSLPFVVASPSSTTRVNSMTRNEGDKENLPHSNALALCDPFHNTRAHNKEESNVFALVVGRTASGGCDAALGESFTFCSRKHALISWRAIPRGESAHEHHHRQKKCLVDEFSIVDLSSTNGTFVDGCRVGTAAEYEAANLCHPTLQDGAHIVFGGSDSSPDAELGARLPDTARTDRGQVVTWRFCVTHRADAAAAAYFRECAMSDTALLAARSPLLSGPAAPVHWEHQLPHDDVLVSSQRPSRAEGASGRRTAPFFVFPTVLGFEAPAVSSTSLQGEVGGAERGTALEDMLPEEEAELIATLVREASAEQPAASGCIKGVGCLDVPGPTNTLAAECCPRALFSELDCVEDVGEGDALHRIEDDEKEELVAEHVPMLFEAPEQQPPTVVSGTLEGEEASTLEIDETRLPAFTPLTGFGIVEASSNLPPSTAAVEAGEDWATTRRRSRSSATKSSSQQIPRQPFDDEVSPDEVATTVGPIVDAAVTDADDEDNVSLAALLHLTTERTAPRATQRNPLPPPLSPVPARPLSSARRDDQIPTTTPLALVRPDTEARASVSARRNESRPRGAAPSTGQPLRALPESAPFPPSRAAGISAGAVSPVPRGATCPESPTPSANVCDEIPPVPFTAVRVGSASFVWRIPSAASTSSSLLVRRTYHGLSAEASATATQPGRHGGAGRGAKSAAAGAGTATRARTTASRKRKRDDTAAVNEGVVVDGSAATVLGALAADAPEASCDPLPLLTLTFGETHWRWSMEDPNATIPQAPSHGVTVATSGERVVPARADDSGIAGLGSHGDHLSFKPTGTTFATEPATRAFVRLALPVSAVRRLAFHDAQGLLVIVVDNSAALPTVDPVIFAAHTPERRASSAAACAHGESEARDGLTLTAKPGPTIAFRLASGKPGVLARRVACRLGGLFSAPRALSDAEAAWLMPVTD